MEVGSRKGEGGRVAGACGRLSIVVRGLQDIALRRAQTQHIFSLPSFSLATLHATPLLPRRLLVHDERPGADLVTSRCVCRTFLCGDHTEHRRAWVRELIRQAAGAFAVEVVAYAVRSNHLHLVVLTDPVRVVVWTSIELATLWASAHPRTGPDGARSRRSGRSLILHDRIREARPDRLNPLLFVSTSG